MAELRTSFDKWHDKNQEDDDVNTLWHNNVINSLDYQHDIFNKEVLEIACGRGGFSNYLASFKLAPRRIFACDYSNNAIQIAISKYGEKSGVINWQVEDIQNLSFSDSNFDSIICCETIEHIPNMQAALNELYRVLKPGGKIFLTFPNYFNLFGVWCVYRWLINKPYTEGGQAYVNYPLLPSVYYRINKAGFVIKRIQTSDFVIPLRAHYHFLKKGIYGPLKIFGLQTFIILTKPIN